MGQESDIGKSRTQTKIATSMKLGVRKREPPRRCFIGKGVPFGPPMAPLLFPRVGALLPPMRASLRTGGAAIAAHLRRGRPLAQMWRAPLQGRCDRWRGGLRSMWELARASRQPERGQIGTGRLLCRATATDPAHDTLSMPVQVIF